MAKQWLAVSVFPAIMVMASPVNVIFKDHTVSNTKSTTIDACSKSVTTDHATYQITMDQNLGLAVSKAIRYEADHDIVQREETSSSIRSNEVHQQTIASPTVSAFCKLSNQTREFKGVDKIAAGEEGFGNEEDLRTSFGSVLKTRKTG